MYTCTKSLSTQEFLLHCTRFHSNAACTRTHRYTKGLSYFLQNFKTEKVSGAVLNVLQYPDLLTRKNFWFQADLSWFMNRIFAYWLGDFLKALFKQIHLLSSVWQFGFKQSVYLTQALTFPNRTECVHGQAQLN